MLTEFTSLPIIDISPLLSALQEPSGRCSGPPGTSEAELVMQQIDEACREVGFFYITGHGVSEELQGRMEQQAQHFFTLPQVHAPLTMSRQSPPSYVTAVWGGGGPGPKQQALHFCTSWIRPAASFPPPGGLLPPSPLGNGTGSPLKSLC